MAIITRIINNTRYLYEEIYVGIKDGKRKYKSKCLGKLDKNGDFIPSKKNRRKAMKDAPAELIIKTTTTRYIIRKKKEKAKKEVTPEIVSDKTAPAAKIDKVSQNAFNTGVNTALYQDTSRKIAMEQERNHHSRNERQYALV